MMHESKSERAANEALVDTVDRIAIRALVLGVALLALSAASLLGQQVPDELTLEDAIALAKSNNPTFLSTANDQAAANWQVREAWAQFVPSVTTNIGGTWQEAGAQRFGSFVFEGQRTDWLYTGYGIDASMRIDGQSIFGVPAARASRRATEARITSAEFELESRVAFQYMTVLRAQDGVDVAQRQLDRARQNLRIVNTRVETGAAAGTDGKQAEVDLGRADVVLIQAERDLRQARLMLSEQIGVIVPADVRLSSEFEVFEPDFEVSELLVMSMEGHPSLRSFRAQEHASRAAARQAATSQYLPSLRVSASMRGQAQEALSSAYVESQARRIADAQFGSCEFNNTLNDGLVGGLPGYTNQDCSQLAFNDGMLHDALAANNNFPFNFSSIPMTVSATFSLPIFTGFSRERQVSEANNVAEDAEHARYAEELRLRTLVTNAYDNLESAYRVVQAEDRNRTLSEEQLQLQQRRYALGVADMLVLMDAQTTMTTADQAYLNAVYEFHYSLILLEAAVGRPLGAL